MKRFMFVILQVCLYFSFTSINVSCSRDMQKKHNQQPNEFYTNKDEAKHVVLDKAKDNTLAEDWEHVYMKLSDMSDSVISLQESQPYQILVESSNLDDATDYVVSREICGSIKCRNNERKDFRQALPKSDIYYFITPTAKSVSTIKTKKLSDEPSKDSLLGILNRFQMEEKEFFYLRKPKTVSKYFKKRISDAQQSKYNLLYLRIMNDLGYIKLYYEYSIDNKECKVLNPSLFEFNLLESVQLSFLQTFIEENFPSSLLRPLSLYKLTIYAHVLTEISTYFVELYLPYLVGINQITKYTCNLMSLVLLFTCELLNVNETRIDFLRLITGSDYKYLYYATCGNKIFYLAFKLVRKLLANDKNHVLDPKMDVLVGYNFIYAKKSRYGSEISYNKNFEDNIIYYILRLMNCATKK